VLNNLPELDMSNDEQLVKTKYFTIEDTNTLVVSNLVDKNRFHSYGLLFVTIGRDGSILNKKYVETSINDTTKTRYADIWMQDGYLHTLAIAYTGYTSQIYRAGFHQKYSYSGELVKNNQFNFYYTLNSYQTNSFNGYVQDNNLYVYGFGQNQSSSTDNKAKYYLAKYDSSYNRISEKIWQYENNSGTVRNIIVAKDTIWLLGEIDGGLYISKIFDSTYTNIECLDNGLFGNRIKVYPNPAQTQLTIHHIKEIENIGLYDLSGRLLRTYSGAGTITVIDISDLDSGVYFLTVDGKSVKFVKE